MTFHLQDVIRKFSEDVIPRLFYFSIISMIKCVDNILNIGEKTRRRNVQIYKISIYRMRNIYRMRRNVAQVNVSIYENVGKSRPQAMNRKT